MSALSISLFQLGAVAMTFVMVYFMSKQSMSNIDMGKPTRQGEIGTIAGYDETGDGVVDPLNYRSDLSHTPVVRRETGEFGAPRVIYKSIGSNIVTYGENYTKF